MEMTMSKVGRTTPRALMGMLALGLALICGLAPAMAQDRPSSTDDRARFVSIARSLEEAPLRPNAREDRAWALSWLTDAPDVSVTICPDSLGGMDQTYPYAGEIMLQYVFSMAVLVIEHPDTANDPNAQQVAGVEGALRSYRAITGGQPDATSPGLDSLMEIESRGGLPDFILAGAAGCSAAT
jgi:hypothetical protein